MTLFYSSLVPDQQNLWIQTGFNIICLIFLRSFGVFCGKLGLFTQFKQVIIKLFTSHKVIFANCLAHSSPCLILVFVNNIYIYIKFPDSFRFVMVYFIGTWICNLIFRIDVCIFVFFIFFTCMFSFLLSIETCIFILLFRVDTWIFSFLFSNLLFWVRFIIVIIFLMDL